MRRHIGSFEAIAVGATSGLVAAWVMEKAQPRLRTWLSGEGEDGGNSSTSKAADRVSLAATGEPVRADKREAAGEAVHYALGAGLGAIYGLIAARTRGITFGFGMVHGLMVWGLLDLFGVPALRLGRSADETPAPDLAYAAASHAVFGVTLETVRRLISFDW